MLGRRRWWAHRQAYGPRPWVWILVAAVLAFSISHLVHPSILGGALIGLVVGYGVTQLVWVRWRRRHPIISIEEQLDAQRRAAPWN